MTPATFTRLALGNPHNVTLLDRLRALALPQGFLTAGCLFQTVWNQRQGQPPGWGIHDYDVFYFDERDLSWEAEDAVIRQVAAATADLGVTVEVRNQARVHLWYRQRFGADYPRLRSAEDGIDRFLIRCTCLGIEAATGRLYAPFGLEELETGQLGPNPVNDQPGAFSRKAASYRARWPWLRLIA